MRPDKGGFLVHRRERKERKTRQKSQTRQTGIQLKAFLKVVADAPAKEFGNIHSPPTASDPGSQQSDSEKPRGNGSVGSRPIFWKPKIQARPETNRRTAILSPTLMVPSSLILNSLPMVNTDRNVLPISCAEGGITLETGSGVPNVLMTDKKDQSFPRL